jgi:hypothetical protein
MTPKIKRFREAYLTMAKLARYRPQAPGDGMGNILLSKQELADPNRLEQEATAYALSFDKEEDTRQFWIGCSDFETNRAFIWTIEAARQLAGGEDGKKTAHELLEMALAELQKTTRQAVTPENPKMLMS